jgi:hypothetical protein
VEILVAAAGTRSVVPDSFARSRQPVEPERESECRSHRPTPDIRCDLAVSAQISDTPGSVGVGVAFPAKVRIQTVSFPAKDDRSMSETLPDPPAP